MQNDNSEVLDSFRLDEKNHPLNTNKIFCYKQKSDLCLGDLIDASTPRREANRLRAL